MNIADRLSAMLKGADLPPLEISEIVRYGADQCGRHRLAFHVTAGGQRLVEVGIAPDGEQEPAERIASILRSLLTGSEDRVADAEQRVANLRHALEQRRREVESLQRKLADFEVGRHGQGEAFAAEDGTGAVWLIGRPSWSAWGLRFENWHDLATSLPGVRPCGVRQAENTTFIVMRAIADLAPTPKDLP